ncbi:uncharacterized protein LOC143209831 [Lasioglossum baleicum]|uniref:uncharacterized protein LOC143209831 n=1 Tax=Lasioglossum baleicum TaxID=434251 RepID=UPI003FCDF72F
MKINQLGSTIVITMDLDGSFEPQVTDGISSRNFDDAAQEQQQGRLRFIYGIRPSIFDSLLEVRPSQIGTVERKTGWRDGTAGGCPPSGYFDRRGRTKQSRPSRLVLADKSRRARVLVGGVLGAVFDPMGLWDLTRLDLAWLAGPSQHRVAS